MSSWLSRLMCPSRKDFSVRIDFRFSLITALHISLSIHLLPNDCLSISSTFFSSRFISVVQTRKELPIFIFIYLSGVLHFQQMLEERVHIISYRFSCIFIWSAVHTMKVYSVDASKLRILGKMNFKEIREYVHFIHSNIQLIYLHYLITYFPKF